MRYLIDTVIYRGGVAVLVFDISSNLCFIFEHLDNKSNYKSI